MARGRVTEHDFDLDDARPQPRAPRPRQPVTAGSVTRDPMRRPKVITRARILASLAILGGGIIVANAVMFQTERHPAPMFQPVKKEANAFPMPPVRPEAYGNRSPAFEPRPIQGMKPGQQAGVAPTAPGGSTQNSTIQSNVAQAPAAADQPTEALITEIQRELGKRGYYKGEPTGKNGPLTAQAIRDFQFAQRVAVDGKPSEQLLRDVQAVKVTMKDELMDLVKRTGPEEKQQRTVLDVQRALNKAGYGPLTEDGQMGPSTRAALTKFEQDKKLPPRGEAKGPVLRALASASGLTIAQ